MQWNFFKNLLKDKKNFLRTYTIQGFLPLFFFSSRGSRSIDTCSICSRIFVDNSDVTRKIDSSFVVTIKSLENLDVCELMKYLNARSAVLNLYYLVGNYGGCTENFHEILTKTANTLFAVYIACSSLSENLF